jgi:hypothetical protein
MRVLLPLMVLVNLWCPLLWAHHAPGHGMSEGVRTINSLGQRGGAAQSRLLWLSEFRSSTTSLNPGETLSTSLYGEWAPVPELSIGAQAPLLLVRERNQATKVGYGDTRVHFRYTPHADKLIHRVVTFGLNFSFPTRSVRLNVDPGKVWTGSLNAMFTRSYALFFWQVMALMSVDHRPAGVALDGGAGFQVGYRTIDKKWSVGGGLIGEMRLVSYCAQPDGTQRHCDQGRAGESNRTTGSIRPHALATLAYNPWSFSSFRMTLYLPVATQRDFDGALSFGWEVFF